MRKKLVHAATLALVAGLLGVTAGPAQAAPVVCGQLITESTKLMNDVGPCPGDGLVIAADNITLDLNGHKIYGVPTPQATISYSVTVRVNGEEHVGEQDSGRVEYTANTGVGVRLGDPVTGASTRINDRPSGVTIKGPGTITQFDAGVAIEGDGNPQSPENNTVTGLNIVDNFSTGQATAVLYGDGVAINDSIGNTVSNNVIKGNGPFSGVGMFGNADNNTVSGNVISDNARFASRSPVHHGAVGFTQETDGIRIEHTCDNNLVTGNTVNENGLDGIAVFPNTVKNIISGNTVNNNGYDVPFAEGAPQRKGDGIRLFGGNATGTVKGVASTLVQSNSVYSNAANGIILGNRTNSNQILNNRTGGNGSALLDFDLKDENTPVPCGTNTWSGNTYTKANPACTTL